MKLDRNLKIDLSVLILHLIISPLIILEFKTPFLVSTVIYFLIPSIYLLVRKPKAIRETLEAVGLFGIIFAILFDLIGEINKAWIVSGVPIIKYSLLGIIPVDGIVWSILWIFYVITFYEHFSIHSHTNMMKKGWMRITVFSLIMLSIFFLIYTINPLILKIPYTYLFLGILGVFMSICILIKKPNFLRDLLLTSLYFIPLCLLFEYTSLSLSHWKFPGQYIYTFPVHGLLIPLEEILFWIIFSNGIIILYYKWWVDDAK